MNGPNDTDGLIGVNDLDTFKEFVRDNKKLIETGLDIKLQLKNFDDKPMWTVKKILGTAGINWKRKQRKDINVDGQRKAAWLYGIDEDNLMLIKRIVKARSEQRKQHEMSRHETLTYNMFKNRQGNLGMNDKILKHVGI